MEYSHFKNIMVTVKKFPEDVLLCSEGPTAGFYPQPDQSSPYSFALFV
jgi:hypothetical protein